MPIVPALAGPLPEAGVAAAALLAACALVLRSRRRRALAAGAALVLAPALLLADVWDSPQLRFAHRSPLAAAGLALMALAAVAGLAALMRRRPSLLPLLAVAAVPFRVPIEVAGDTANLLVPLYLVVGAGAAAWIWEAVREPEARERGAGALEWALAAYLALYGIAAAWSPDFSKALQNVVFFYVPFAVLFALLARTRWTGTLLRRCLLVLAGLAVAFACIGFFEYATKTLLLNPKLLVSNDFHAYFRVNSVFFDPNIFGRFLVVVMLLIATVLLDSRRGRTVAGLLAVLAVLWGGLVLTLSQSSLVGLLAGLAVLAALRWPPRRVLAACAGLAALGVAFVALFPSVTGIDVRSFDRLNADSSGRADLISGGLELWQERPVLGWGSGSFARQYRRLGKGSAQQAVSASHTIPITVAAEQGVVGLLAYLALLAAALARLFPGARGSTPRTALAAAFVALLVHTLVYAAFLEDPLAWALLAVASALALAPRAERGGRRGEGAAPAPGNVVA